MPPGRAATKWDPDPADPNVRRWQENLRRGSASTGDSWFRALRRFCAGTQRTPAELSRLKGKPLRDVFLDFADADAGRGASGTYTAYTIKVAKNWLRFNGVSPPEGIKVRGSDSVFEETALSTEQFRAALGAATPREKVAMVLMGQAGLRPEVIGSFEGADGLRVGDIQELTVGRKSVEFAKVPAVIVVRQELSKASHRYVTFLGEEGTAILGDYLHARIAAGEKIAPESAIFPPERTDLTPRAFVRTTKIGDSLRRALRSAGLPNRPYVLRTTIASRFAEAENKGWVPHSFWQHWLGHTGDMSARYSVNRGRIPASLLEEMRRAYKRCEPLLSTVPTSSASDREQRTLRLLLRVAGYSETEVEKLDLVSMTDEQILELAEKKRATPNASATRPAGQRAVLVAEVGPLLEAGWEYVDGLGRDLAILRAPPPVRPSLSG